MPAIGKCDGEDATGSPQSSQFLSCDDDRVIDGIGLGELPVESMFTTCSECQCQCGMPREVADQIQVIGAERLLLRIPRHSDDSQRSFIRDQGDDDRRPFAGVGEAFDRILERIGDQRDTAPCHTTGG